MPKMPAKSLFSISFACLIALASPGLAQTSDVPASQPQITLSFAPVVKAATPAVVNIFATTEVQGHLSPFANDPLFAQLFGSFGQAASRAQNALGSGVIVSADGIVVSNYHVVGQASEIRVVLNDRREFAAKVILGDKESDLAILKLEGATDLPALSFRNSDELQVGDLVLAIGNPFGVGQTVSQGIVSGLARSAAFVGDGLGSFIQTDAAINPGNSGGALVDVRGQLVGINTAILERQGGATGIGFAIPANLVAAVVQQAEQGADRFQRPWAGVSGQAMDAALADGLSLPHPDGVILNTLQPESPFLAAGLDVGDVILTIEGQPVNAPQEIIARLAALGVGGKAKVGYLRDGRNQEAEVALIAPPDVPDRQRIMIAGETPLAGLTVARINPAVIEELNLPSGASGVIVIAAEGTSARAGLQPGDILLGINGQEIKETAQVKDASDATPRRWTIDLMRDGQPMRLRFRT